MRNHSLRLLPALVAASLLAACAGGGGTGSGLPVVTPNSNAPAIAGDFQATSAYRAVGDAGTPIAYFAPNDGLWQFSHGMTYRTARASNNLIYGSGPVQTAPALYVVYWGSAWNGAGDPDGVKAYLDNFLAHVGGTTWNATVTQYSMKNPSGFAGNPAGNFAGSYVDTSSAPPKHPTQSQMATEAKKAEAHFGNKSANAQYIVAMPHGIVPSGFKTQYCAYHATASVSGAKISWTNLPYLPDAGSGCGAKSVTSSVLDGVSIVEGHEMAESETDPQLGAWLDSSGEEIGDKCAWVNLQDTNLNGTSFPTQPLWSNATSSCVQSY